MRSTVNKRADGDPQLTGRSMTTAGKKESSTSEKKKERTWRLELLKLADAKPAEAIDPIPRRVCYVLHNSLPYSSGGYATRAQGIALGFQEAGYDVVCMTRPG